MSRIPLNHGDTIQLNNRQYTIDSVIGDGATCIVYSAYYTDNMGLPHRVNIKECYPYNANITRNGQKLYWDSEEEKSKSIVAFCNAYEKLMVCQNGNFTVHAFDICEANQTQYIVMDANSGVTFDKDTSASLSDILKTVRLLAYVIDNYHKNGYLHLDIKPSNFLVYPRPSEHIVLFDMDTVTLIDDISNGKVKCVSYSDGWAAPEQKQGKISKLCPATDIYAIGAVLFEKIMDRPVDAADMGIFADWDFDGELFENINPKIKRLLRNIFRKTLSANIKRRYQSASELIKDLTETIKTADSDVFLKGDDVCCSGCFFGRQNELTLIKTFFDSKKKAVFLHGFGGIGKTEIARRYAQLNSNHYDIVLFVKYNKNETLQELLNEIEIVNFDTDDSKERWRKLRTLLDEHTLVIVDNFDIEIGTDNGLKALFETKANILVTTRTDFRNIYSGDKYAYVEVKELATDDLQQIFLTNAKINSITDNEREILNRIFKLIENHTYATELVAKQMSYSGWNIEFLYQKVKSGFSSLENVERIITNKDEDTVKDNSLNILRAVFNISDLTEDRKQVLRNLYLLGFMNITKDVFKKYTSAGVKDIDALNDLVELGIVYSDSLYYSLHPLIEELVKQDMNLTKENCYNFYCYIESKIFNTCNYCSDMEHGDADEYEFENDCEFLCAFFYRANLLDLYNRSLLLGWLLGIIENEEVEIGYPEYSCFSKIYKKISHLADKNLVSAKEKYDIYYIILCAWLLEFHCIYFEESKQPKIREENFRRYLNLCVDSCNCLEEDLKEECLDRTYKTVIGQALESVFAFEAMPRDIVKKIYVERPHLFLDINDYYKDRLVQILNEEKKSELDTFSNSKSDYIDNDTELEVSCKEGFYNSTDKYSFVKRIIEDETYSPIKRAELVRYCTDSIFDRLYYDYRLDVKIDWDWDILEDILDLEEEYLISDECNPEEQEDIRNLNHYIQANTINKIIVYAATENVYNFEEYFNMLLEEIGRKISALMKHNCRWTRFLSIRDYEVFSLNILNNALTTLKKAHLMLPYLIRYLEGWQEYAKKINCEDERVFFSLYKVISECAMDASSENVCSEKYIKDFHKIEFLYCDKMDNIVGLDYSLKTEED